MTYFLLTIIVILLAGLVLVGFAWNIMRGRYQVEQAKIENLTNCLKVANRRNDELTAAMKRTAEIIKKDEARLNELKKKIKEVENGELPNTAEELSNLFNSL